MAKLTNEEIIASLKEMTILELNDLVKAIEEEFGVTAAAPANVTVTLTDVGATKVAVIKTVREITGAGLVEAKGIVDKCPAVIKENIPAEEGKAIKEKLEAAGATVEVK